MGPDKKKYHQYTVTIQYVYSIVNTIAQQFFYKLNLFQDKCMHLEYTYQTISQSLLPWLLNKYFLWCGQLDIISKRPRKLYINVLRLCLDVGTQKNIYWVNMAVNIE